MKKIVIFGATGNIGAYLVDYLKYFLDDFQIIATGRKNTNFYNNKGIDYINVDICNKDDFDKLPIDDIFAVINCAGILPAYLSDFNPYFYVDVNIIGSLNILEYARRVNADRVVYTQTWSVQGGYWNKEEMLSPKMGRKLVYKGDHAFYSITKNMIEDTLYFYYEEFGLKYYIFRLPNVYLYHPSREYYVDGVKKVIGYRKMIDMAINNENITLWGDPQSYKDILYVKDLCQLIYRALMTSKINGVYNAGTGIKTTLQEQIEGIIEVFSDNKSQILFEANKSNFTSFVMDIENAVEDLGYKPEYTYKKYLIDYKKEMEEKRFNSLWN